MKGIILCLIVIVAVDAVRSQGPPTKTKKGRRPSRPNDNPDFGLPSGADIPDGRRMNAVAPKPAAAPAAGRAIPPASAARPPARPAAARRPAPAAAPAAPAAAPAARPSPVRSGPPPPGRRPAGRRNDNPDFGLPSGRDFPDAGLTRTRSGPPPPAARRAPAPAPAAAPAAGRRNDNPDFGLPSGRDFPDAGWFPFAAPAPVAPVAPAPAAPVYDCDYSCQFQGYKPVCTIYGNEYDNDCYRKCRNEPRDCENACPCDAAGPDPAPVVPGSPFAGPCDYCYAEGQSTVCVDNEENVFNECVARCEGKTVTCTDVCPCN